MGNSISRRGAEVAVYASIRNANNYGLQVDAALR